ncbi:MAG: alpha/beta fold hydrolase, partial [Anaerolineales bacterium]
MDMRLLTDLTWDFAPWHELASAFRCPWLLLIGEQGGGRDGIVSRARAEEAVRLSAHGQWAQIPNAGHNVRYDQFEEYIGVVKEFLENLEKVKHG